MASMSLPTYPSIVIAALMRNAAREAVKYNIRAEGLKVRDFAAKDITRMAEAFVGNNRDKLLAGALRTIERSPESQRLLEKEQREWAKRIAKQVVTFQSKMRPLPLLRRPKAQGLRRWPAPRKRVFMRPVRRPNSEYRVREHLTEAEVAKLLETLRSNRHGHRDWLIGLLIYRHGLRVSEACELRWDDLDLTARTINVRRLKGSRDSTHYLERMGWRGFADCPAKGPMCL